jgi:hypothetical protein
MRSLPRRWISRESRAGRFTVKAMEAVKILEVQPRGTILVSSWHSIGSLRPSHFPPKLGRHRPLYRHLLAHTHLTMLSLSNSLPPHPHSLTSLTPAPTHLSVVPLPSPRTLQLQHTTAVRRGAASCRAVLRSRPGTRRQVSARGAVTGCERRRRGHPSEVCAVQPASPSSWPSRMSGGATSAARRLSLVRKQTARGPCASGLSCSRRWPPRAYVMPTHSRARCRAREPHRPRLGSSRLRPSSLSSARREFRSLRSGR